MSLLSLIIQSSKVAGSFSNMMAVVHMLGTARRLHSGHDTSHFSQQCIVVRFLHALNNACYHVFFTIMAILVSMKPCVIVVLICISLISGAGEPLFLALVYLIPYLAYLF